MQPKKPSHHSTDDNPRARKRYIETLIRRYFTHAEKQNLSGEKTPFPHQAVLERITMEILRRRKRYLRRWRIAASFIGVLSLTGLAVWTYMHIWEPPGDTQVLAAADADVDPGKNQAVLELADGRRIALNEQVSGQIAGGQGAGIVKAGDGMLVYLPDTGKTNAPAGFHTIRTPRGGVYTVTLPDGSLVRLNAATTLRYPTSFSGDTRDVEVNGEAYFEVVHNRRKPFRVRSGDQLITVLGTKFNVNSYANEPIIRTTLLEGSVRIHKNAGQVVLKPGEEALVDSEIRVRKVNLQKATAWIQGDFIFRNDRLNEIMRQIARWYDVDVEYQGSQSAGNLHFGGIISRSRKLSSVLTMLERTGRVKFELKIHAGADRPRLIVSIL